MNKEILQQAVTLSENIVRTYYSNRDIYAVLDNMAEDATWIGPGENEKTYTLEEMRTYFELGKDSVPSCEVSSPNLRAVDLGDDYCLVIGSITVRTTPDSELLLEVNQRLSFTYRYRDGKLKVVHLHNSNPYGDMSTEEYFPHKMGAQSYRYLKQLLREKTEVIDMIAANINGGLKGSNDDSTFSYFYVNKGLPHMLGFTYDEFMQKTGGTAVGAVYPPDLPAALADCERCFANGQLYSAEYRMEKKDGSLIWVLDSGRKVTDSDGVTRINSIITDITPLKHALFDLEVERERYRIALQNITGVMCEYDIGEDLLTVFGRLSDIKNQNAITLEIPHFTREVASGTLMNGEDGVEFLALCTGKRNKPLELQTCFLHPKNKWYWAEFSCSVITDSNDLPVRTIGMLKDITEDKERNLDLMEQAQRDGLTRLLNQTALRDTVQHYLAQDNRQANELAALLMIDLDHFKEVNDGFGHLYGNEMLVKTAQVLTDAAGSNSIIGRSGGDEFIVMLKDATADAAQQLADVIVKQVALLGLERSCPMSCSIGVVLQQQHDEGFIQLFERADRALYRAKDLGRNRCATD